MKIRNGFVSNSSSSSFICDVCGYESGGYGDASLADVDMCVCENDHLFCSQHAVNTDRFVFIKNTNRRSYDSFEEALMDDRHNIPEIYCPICSLKKITDDDMLKYLLKKYHTNKEEVSDEIREIYKTYTNFKTFIKSNE